MQADGLFLAHARDFAFNASLFCLTLFPFSFFLCLIDRLRIISKNISMRLYGNASMPATYLRAMVGCWSCLSPADADGGRRCKFSNA